MKDDLISRQAAIDAIHNLYAIHGSEGSWIDQKDAFKALNSLPSAQRTGKWIIRDNPGTGWYRVTCSECGEDVTSTAPCIGFFPNAKVTWNYCPECGARMDAERKEE